MLSQTSITTPFGFSCACDTRLSSRLGIFVCMSQGLMTCGNSPPGLLSIFLWHSSLEHTRCVTPREREAEDRCGDVSISLGFNKSTKQSDSFRVRRCARSSSSKSRLCSSGCRGITDPVVLCSYGILNACDDLGLLAGFFSTTKAIMCCGQNVKALLTPLFSTCRHLSELLRCFCSHSIGTWCSHLRPRAVLRVSLYLEK